MKTQAIRAALAAIPLFGPWVAAEATDFSHDFSTEAQALRQVREGRNTFRYATFGDETFWGDGIGLHQAIAGAANGGVGPGLSPTMAIEFRFEGRRRRIAALIATCIGARQGGSQRSRHYSGIAQARCGGRRHRHLRQPRQAHLHGHAVRVLSFDRRQLVRQGNRQPPRRLGQSRPQRRRHRGAGAAARAGGAIVRDRCRDRAYGPELLGTREI